MSKPRIMGAGLAGSTTLDANVNGNQGGGTKKQGLPGYTNMRSSLVFSVNQRAYGTPDSRNKVFYINQLSRVGAKSTMFASTADGVISPPILLYNNPIHLKVLDNQQQQGFTLTSETINGTAPLISSSDEIKSTASPATTLRLLNRDNITSSNQVTYNSSVYIAKGDSSDTTNPVIAYGKNQETGLFFDTLDNLKNTGTELYYVWRIGSELSQNANTNDWEPINSKYSGINYNNNIMFYSPGGGNDANQNQWHLTSNCGWYGCRTMHLDSDGSISYGHGNAFPTSKPSFVSFEVLKVD